MTKYLTLLLFMFSFTNLNGNNIESGLAIFLNSISNNKPKLELIIPEALKPFDSLDKMDVLKALTLSDDQSFNSIQLIKEMSFKQDSFALLSFMDKDDMTYYALAKKDSNSWKYFLLYQYPYFLDSYFSNMNEFLEFNKLLFGNYYVDKIKSFTRYLANNKIVLDSIGGSNENLPYNQIDWKPTEEKLFKQFTSVNLGFFVKEISGLELLNHNKVETVISFIDNHRNITSKKISFFGDKLYSSFPDWDEVFDYHILENNRLVIHWCSQGAHMYFLYQ